MLETPLLRSKSEVLNPENYIDKPLPIRSAIPDRLSRNRIENLQFKNFDVDPDSNGENILLYRRLSNQEIDIENLVKTANLSSAASRGKSQQEVLKEQPEATLLDIVSQYILSTKESSPILHTTFDRQLTRPSRGAVITFSVPKEWILEHRTEIFTGAKSEKEIAFFHSLPWEFVKSILVSKGMNDDFQWDETIYIKEELYKLKQQSSS